MKSETKIYSVLFHGVQPFALLYSYCKSHAIGTTLDVFGLSFSFDSFKYVNFNLKITLPYLKIGSYVSVRSSRYEALGKFGEHERCVRVARGVTFILPLFISDSSLGQPV